MGTKQRSIVSCHIIDRTVLEIFRAGRRPDAAALTTFIYLLKSMGVSLVEVASAALDELRTIPSEWIVLRVEEDEDVRRCIECGIKHCVIEMKLADLYILKKLQHRHINAVLEINADSEDQLNQQLDLVYPDIVHYINCLRVTGLREYEHRMWGNKLKEIQQYRVTIDLCPGDSLHTAGSIALEGFLHGVQYLTASFCGFGDKTSYASLEEIMTAMMVLTGMEAKYNLTVLPELCDVFCGITGKRIPDNKPVIGSSIFNYESGVHAHGIDKNPTTYEPFDPAMVGRKRQMKIGKHSGKNAIEKKLMEMGVNSSGQNLEMLLEAVRVKSVLLRRDLCDEEILSMIRV